jgi:hypothetical protein
MKQDQYIKNQVDVLLAEKGSKAAEAAEIAFEEAMSEQDVKEAGYWMAVLQELRNRKGKRH